MPTETSIRTSVILLLERNCAETALIEEVVQNTRLCVVTEGADILAFLRGQGSYAAADRPDLVLLDLDLSKAQDCELLQELKRDPSIKRIPVVVLSSSVSYEDIFEAYDLHANAYLCKPSTRKDYGRVLRATLHFWLHLARLPRD